MEKGIQRLARRCGSNGSIVRIRCPLQRKRQYEASSLRRAIIAMLTDRFSPEEIALGLECELSEVLQYVEERHEWTASAAI